MCQLLHKVERIMRDCGRPMTAARIRYVLLYCAKRHMQNRTCARRCDVGICVAVIMQDLNDATVKGKPTRMFLHELEKLELEILTNIQCDKCAVHLLKENW
jgi:hypothetical protein